MSYPDLPPEVLNQITSLLDISDAISLAQTSSFSQQAAESRIWRNVKIDAIDRFHSSPDDGFEGDKLKRVSTEKYYQPYISLILLQPWRASSVRSLVVEPQFTPPPELAHLLKLISGGLHHLEITYPTGMLVPSGPLVLISRLIGETALPALESIEVDIGENWDCLGPLLRGSRCLKRLIVRGPETLGGLTVSAMALGVGTGMGMNTNHTQSTTAIPNSGTYKIEEIDTEVPDVLQLEYLSIDRMDSVIIPILAKIIKNSPKLRTVILRDPLMAWFPFLHPSGLSDEPPSPSRQADPLLLALAANDSIRTLDIPSTCLKAMDRVIFDEGGFEKITDLTIVWEFPHLYACSGGGNGVDDVLMPTLPNLKHCIFTLRTHHCDPNAPPYNIYRGYIFDLSIKAIKRHALLTNFDSTPLLESVQLRDMYGVKGEGSHPRCETEFDGALITRYRGEKGDLLVVLRHRVAHSCGWEEYAVYQGREVPWYVLNGLMSVSESQISGRRRKPVEPGWGVLNAEAWDVLKHWATLS